METIASFTVDHLKLLPGVYVSRKDCTGTDIGIRAVLGAFDAPFRS